MTRVLHAMLMSKVAPGVVNQMRWEMQAAQDLELEWSVKIFCPDADQFEDSSLFVKSRVAHRDLERSPFRRFIFWMLFRIDYYMWLRRERKKYDYYLIRYSVGDPFLLLFSLCFRGKFFLVHHTLELPELRHYRGFVAFAMYWYERAVGWVNLRCADGLIGVTGEIVEHEMSRLGRGSSKLTYVYPNGIRYSGNIEVADRRGVDSALTQIVFVASHFYEWHGLDVLLADVVNSTDDFILHLVGTMSEHDLHIAQNDPRIVLHGTLNAVQLSDLYAKCTVGLSSFGLERKGMTMACTLKVREYLRAGLPVYAGHLDVFPVGFRFYRRGSASIREILTYCAEVGMHGKTAVSVAAVPHISKVSLLGRLYHSIAAGIR